MSANAELQQEELEVLRSIYQGDDCFKEISPNVFQYKIGEDQSPKSFLLEMSWGENYPSEPPAINLDAFYNKHIVPEVKNHVIQSVLERAQEMLDMAMTFSLFEFAKENCDELLSSQPDILPQSVADEKQAQVCYTEATTKVKEKKEHLTKAQKRKLYNIQDVKGEMPRGWNWVDIVKHLSQTGKSQENVLSSNSAS